MTDRQAFEAVANNYDLSLETVTDDDGDVMYKNLSTCVAEQIWYAAKRDAHAAWEAERERLRGLVEKWRDEALNTDNYEFAYTTQQCANEIAAILGEPASGRAHDRHSTLPTNNGDG